MIWRLNGIAFNLSFGDDSLTPGLTAMDCWEKHDIHPIFNVVGQKDN